MHAVPSSLIVLSCHGTRLPSQERLRPRVPAPEVPVDGRQQLLVGWGSRRLGSVAHAATKGPLRPDALLTVECVARAATTVGGARPTDLVGDFRRVESLGAENQVKVRPLLLPLALHGVRPVPYTTHDQMGKSLAVSTRITTVARVIPFIAHHCCRSTREASAQSPLTSNARQLPPPLASMLRRVTPASTSALRSMKQARAPACVCPETERCRGWVGRVERSHECGESEHAHPLTRLQGVDPGETVAASQLQHRLTRPQRQCVVPLSEEAHEVDARLPDLEPACRAVVGRKTSAEATSHRFVREPDEFI